MRQAELIAILGGCDWADASVEFIKLPLSVDLGQKKLEYNQWYRKEYLVSLREKKSPEYYTFPAWLVKYHGAVEPSATDLEVLDLTGG